MSFQDVGTMEINKLSEYLEVIESIDQRQMTSSSVSNEVFYRGQANYKWSLQPSLFRNNLYVAERVLLKKLEFLSPNDFIGDKFDILSKLQHYGMPTRLLDTTTNPLVALYFACKDDKSTDEDGAVFYWPNMPVVWSDDIRVKIIMESTFYNDHLFLDIGEFRERSLISLAKDYGFEVVKNYDSSKIARILSVVAVAVNPKKLNERLKAQSGTFLLFGMEATKADSNMSRGKEGCYTFKPRDNVKVEDIFITGKTIRIPYKAKTRILDELSLLGIDESSLFPDLEHKSRYVVDFIKRQYLDNYTSCI